MRPNRKKRPTAQSRSASSTGASNTGHAPLALALLTLTVIWLTACGSKTELGLRQLAAEFRSANQAKTIEPMLALYHTDGADERTLSQLKGALKYELGLPIKSIEFVPLSGAPEETIDFACNGVAYGPSLKPSMRMLVMYESEDAFTSLFTVGQTESGRWRIVCASPITSPSPKLSPPPPSH